MSDIEHRVLALKYRPKNFKELIGQDIMVETVTNSIKLNKLPNAYLLTGIRGVGKTTTARLIAKADFPIQVGPRIKIRGLIKLTIKFNCYPK